MPAFAFGAALCRQPSSAAAAGRPATLAAIAVSRWARAYMSRFRSAKISGDSPPSSLRFTMPMPFSARRSPRRCLPPVVQLAFAARFKLSISRRPARASPPKRSGLHSPLLAEGHRLRHHFSIALPGVIILPFSMPRHFISHFADARDDGASAFALDGRIFAARRRQDDAFSMPGHGQKVRQLCRRQITGSASMPHLCSRGHSRIILMSYAHAARKSTIRFSPHGRPSKHSAPPKRAPGQGAAQRLRCFTHSKSTIIVDAHMIQCIVLVDVELPI